MALAVHLLPLWQLARGKQQSHCFTSHSLGRSPVFEAMLNLPMREGRERLIQIEDMSAKALWEFLFFLYTGRFRRDFDVEVRLQCHGMQVAWYSIAIGLSVRCCCYHQETLLQHCSGTRNG